MLKVSVSEGVVLISKGVVLILEGLVSVSVLVLDGQVSVLVSVSDFEAETPSLGAAHYDLPVFWMVCVLLWLPTDCIKQWSSNW